MTMWGIRSSINRVFPMEIGFLSDLGVSKYVERLFWENWVCEVGFGWLFLDGLSDRTVFFVHFLLLIFPSSSIRSDGFWILLYNPTAWLVHVVEVVSLRKRKRKSFALCWALMVSCHRHIDRKDVDLTDTFLAFNVDHCSTYVSFSSMAEIHNKALLSPLTLWEGRQSLHCVNCFLFYDVNCLQIVQLLCIKNRIPVLTHKHLTPRV